MDASGAIRLKHWIRQRGWEKPRCLRRRQRWMCGKYDSELNSPLNGRPMPGRRFFSPGADPKRRVHHVDSEFFGFPHHSPPTRSENDRGRRSRRSCQSTQPGGGYPRKCGASPMGNARERASELKIGNALLYNAIDRGPGEIRTPDTRFRNRLLSLQVVCCESVTIGMTRALSGMAGRETCNVAYNTFCRRPRVLSPLSRLLNRDGFEDSPDDSGFHKILRRTLLVLKLFSRIP